MSTRVNIRATLRIQNLEMIAARERLGLTIQEVCKRARTTPSTFCDLQRFKFSGGKIKKETLREHVDRIAIVLGIPSDVIMPSELEDVEIESRAVMDRSVDVEALLLWSGNRRMLTASPEDIAEGNEAVEILNAAIAKLRPREARVIRMRMDGETFEKIGNTIGACKDRVRQIEENAHRKLRGLMESPRLSSTKESDSEVLLG